MLVAVLARRDAEVGFFATAGPAVDFRLRLRDSFSELIESELLCLDMADWPVGLKPMALLMMALDRELLGRLTAVDPPVF